MRDQRIDLAVELIKLDIPDIETTDLVKKILEEFKVECTVKDINAIYASYLPDNFEAESKIIEHYERNFINQY